MLETFALDHPGQVIAVEGPNEKGTSFSYNGFTGEAALQAYMTDLVSAASGSSALNGVETYGHTANDTLSPTDDAAQFANNHPYPDRGDQPAAKMEQGYNNVHSLAGKPVVFTEVGYNTATTNGGVPGTHEGVDFVTQAKISLNLLFDAIQAGASRVFYNELFDAYNDPANTSTEKNEGLFDESVMNKVAGDSSTFVYNAAKPAAVALHNFSSVLQSAAGIASASVSELMLPSTTPTGIYSLQLEKTGGIKALAVWAEPDIWDEQNNVAVAAPETTVTVKLGTLASTIRIYDPLQRETPIAVDTNVKSIKIAVVDHPVIVEVLSNDPVIKGTSASETITGTDFNDSLDGSGGADTVNGGSGTSSSAAVGSTHCSAMPGRTFSPSAALATPNIRPTVRSKRLPISSAMPIRMTHLLKAT